MDTFRMAATNGGYALDNLFQLNQNIKPVAG